MSPLIDLQRRMMEAGRIRAGDKGDKGQPQKLVNWRLTSKDKVRLDAAATLWGGEVREWAERKGEWELYTDTAALPILLLPGQLPTSWYELWSKGGCQRRCDGHHEIVSDGPCLCGEERECKPYTRMSVLLPDLPGLGSWLLSSTGWNAAAELAGAAELLQRASAQGVLIPARLRLEQRVEVKAGQTRRFAVPVIDIDVSFRDLLTAQGGGALAMAKPELPSGYVPLTGNGGPGMTLEQGLEIVETQQVTRTKKGSTPIPPAPDDIEFGTTPVAVPNENAAPTKKITPAQKKALDSMVGQLREAGHITTEQMWAAVSKLRGGTSDITELLAAIPDGRDEDLTLHWGPLRDTLTKDEASSLFSRLERLQANLAATT